MSPSAARRRILPNSPFKPAETVVVQDLAEGDLVSHDAHGLGRVIAVEPALAVIVQFGSERLRLTTPFAKVTKL